MHPMYLEEAQSMNAPLSNVCIFFASTLQLTTPHLTNTALGVTRAEVYLLFKQREQCAQ